MGYCKKWIFRNMMPWLIMTFSLGVVSLFYAVRLPQIDNEVNILYKQQSVELGLANPQVVADSSDAIIIFAIFGVAFILCGCFSLSKFFRPQTSRMGKSLLRYAEYEGEGDIQELLNEVNEDLAHSAVFGDIAIGKNWIAGRSFPPGGQAVRLFRLCAIYHTTENITRRGASGISFREKWYHIYLFDEMKRKTELLTPKSTDLMAAYHTLLRRNPALLHGGEKEYCDFMDLPDDEQERLLNKVTRETYDQKYITRRK